MTIGLTIKINILYDEGWSTLAKFHECDIHSILDSRLKYAFPLSLVTHIRPQTYAVHLIFHATRKVVSVDINNVDIHNMFLCIYLYIYIYIYSFIYILIIKSITKTINRAAITIFNNNITLIIAIVLEDDRVLSHRGVNVNNYWCNMIAGINGNLY